MHIKSKSYVAMDNPLEINESMNYLGTNNR